MKEFGIAIVGGLVAALVGVVAQYYISYKLIEEPKIDIEKKKITLEAHKQAASLIPSLDTSCSSSPSDSWTWHITCETKSATQYAVNVSIEKVEMIVNNDRKETHYSEGETFTVSFPNDKKQFLAFPSSNATLDFFIKINNKIAPNGITVNYFTSVVKFKYSTTDSAKNILFKAFPEMSDLLKDDTVRYHSIYTTLPPTAQ